MKSAGTAKLNNVDPQAWPADVLARTLDYLAKQIGGLLPWSCLVSGSNRTIRVSPRAFRVPSKERLKQHEMPPRRKF
jgi:IS66 C-terminal element